MRSIEQLTEEILSLPNVSRVFLVEKLIESLEFDIEPMNEEAWVNEAKKRRDEIRNGTIQAISGEDALTQVRNILES